MKKLFCMFSAVLLAVSLLSVAAFADSKPMFTAEKVSAKPDSTVSVPITLSNNTGIWGLAINVHFDTSAFSVVEIRNNNDVFRNGEFTIGPSDFTKGYVRVCAFSNNVNVNNKKNGTLCTIVLSVKKNVVDGDYPITFEYDDKSVCDVNGKYVSIASKNGDISVSTKAENVVETKKDDGGDVIAQAKNGKLVTDATTVKTQKNKDKTQVVTRYVTDKNGNNVTNSKGEKETVTEYVTEENQVETDENGSTISENKNKSNSEKSLDNNNANQKEDKGSLSVTSTILIILGAIVAAGIVVSIIVIVVKKKK